GAGEVAADAPAAAAGVEDPGSAPGHRVEQPGLAVDVLAGGLEASPALRVAAGVLGIAAQRRAPQVLVGAREGGGAHPPIVPRRPGSRRGSVPPAPRACPPG